MKNIFLFSCFYFLAPVIFAQEIDFPDQFKDLLNQVSIDFYEPVEAKYQDFKVKENDFGRYDFRMASRKEKLEIRYSITPFDVDDFMSQNPHLLTMRAISSIATNDQEYIISATQMSEQVLQSDFNADWGMTYFFTPKTGFSNSPHCRMIALYKEGKGTVFIYYLFDDPGNEALDTRYFALRFLKDKVILD